MLDRRADARLECLIQPVRQVSFLRILCHGDGAGVAQQERAIGAAVQAVPSLVDGFLGGRRLVTRDNGAAEIQEAGDVSTLEASLGVGVEVVEETHGAVDVTPVLAEVEGGLQDAALLARGRVLEDLRVGQP